MSVAYGLGLGLGIPFLVLLGYVFVFRHELKRRFDTERKKLLVDSKQDIEDQKKRHEVRRTLTQIRTRTQPEAQNKRHEARLEAPPRPSHARASCRHARVHAHGHGRGGLVSRARGARTARTQIQLQALRNSAITSIARAKADEANRRNPTDRRSTLDMKKAAEQALNLEEKGDPEDAAPHRDRSRRSITTLQLPEKYQYHLFLSYRVDTDLPRVRTP